MRRLLCLLVLATGCNLYWNEGDDDCKGYGYADDVAPGQELRNPTTGLCEPWGYPDYGCDDACGPCAYDQAGGAPRPDPDWPSCYSQCTALGESECFTAPGCQATYDLVMAGGTPTKTQFAGCVGTSPLATTSTGSCTGLDAELCNRHDNCVADYGGITTNFLKCDAEPAAGACGAIDCGPGYHCEDQCKDTCGNGGDCGPQCGTMCVPDGNVCANVDCGAGSACVETCIDPTPTHNGQCYASCEPISSCGALTTEAECTARTDCTTVYNGEDCTCYPNEGCTCQVLTYDHCETL